MRRSIDQSIRDITRQRNERELPVCSPAYDQGVLSTTSSGFYQLHRSPSCARDSLSMTEPGGKKVLTASTSQATGVDMSRKRTSTASNSRQRPDDASTGSSSITELRDRQLDKAETEGPERRNDHTKEHHRRRHKHQHRDERSAHKEERRYRNFKHKHNQETSRLKIASLDVLPQTATGSDHLDSGFFEDRTGDQYNITYGSVHRYSIPRYRAAGYQCVIGLGRTQKILQSLEGSARVVTGDHRDSDVRVKAHSLLVGNVDRQKSPTQLVPAGTTRQARDAELERDFLALSGRGSRKRRRLEAQDFEQKNAEQELISQTWSTSESGSEESGSDSSSESIPENSFHQFRHDARQQRTVELSRAVHDCPQDVGAWLALIEHQDDNLHARDSMARGPTNTENHGSTDVKISIYETALSKNTSNPERDRLILGLMDEGAKIWDAKKLANKWRTVLKANSRFPSLWIKYLDFEQSNFLSFTYDQCKSVYAECLQIALTLPPNRDRDQLRTYVLLRLTAFVKDAGYSEHGVALWQAILEYNYFHSDGLEDQAEKSLFEDFWNSEVARIGEDGARGWKVGLNPEVASASDVSNLAVDSMHIFHSWPDCEQERTQNASLPARTLHEVIDDDPYRVIISSDISEYLFRIIEPGNKTLLPNAFLCFCGLPPIHGPGLEQRWWTDTFLRSPELILVETPPDPGAQRDSLTTSPITNFVTDTSTMFSDPKIWFSCWQENASPNSRFANFQKLALRQLVDGLPELDYLAEYVVAHQLKHYGKEARRVAKALLKQRPSNLRLYNAYAMVEYRLGYLETAERVWSTALAMSNTFAENSRQNASLLWRTWIWQLLDGADLRKALALLLAIPEGLFEVDNLSRQALSISNDVRSTAVLKAKRHLESHLAHATSLRHADEICDYSDLLALLSYLTSNYSLTTAVAVYATIIDPPNSTSTLDPNTLELLHQSRARLTHLHARTRTGFRPREITSTLAESVRRFPSNTIFLTLYHQHTQRTLLTDRIRTVLPTLRSSSSDPAAKDSIVPAVFEVWAEMNRPRYAGSTNHSVRAAFERALEAGRPGSHSLGLWRWYLQWELSVWDDKPTANFSSSSRPQDVFYRGMRACPWAKEFYMLAFTQPRLRDAIGFGGLRKIYQTVVEKGLRIHVELSEILEGRDGRER